MSGIVAIFNPDDRPVEPRFLDRVAEAAAYRAHDGLGKSMMGPIGLACAACHTTPQALGETQPFVDPQGDLVIAFDGRVDNRDELVSAMRGRGIEPRGAGDAELVACAWRCWGEDSPRRLLGDFAFALWDSRARRLICVRDPAGVKSLYYAADAHTFLAASELHQVLMHPGVDEYPNEAMAAEYMCGTLLGREETMFRDVLRLPPGEMLIVSRGGIARRRYYELTPGRAIRYRTDAEYAEHFLDVFGEAVRCRMVASGAGVASDLSGGLDSSFIVGVAQALIRDGSCSPDRFETYFIRATDPGADEYDYFRAVADMWRLDTHVVRPSIVDRQSCVELLRHYRDFSEYPNGSTYLDINFQVRREDFRVMLSGSGGDHWLQGSDDYCADLLRGLRLGRLMTVLRSGHGCIDGGSDWRGGLRMFARHAMVPLLPLALQKALRRATGRGMSAPCLNPDFARRVNLDDRFEAAMLPRQRGMTFGQHAVYEAFVHPWSAHALEIADRDAARAGIERRHPFYDRRVIEFLIAIPEEQRCDGLRTKAILRNAGRELMPKSVRDRMTKAEASSLAARAIRKMVEGGILDDMALDRWGWLVVPRFRELCERFASGLGGVNGWMVWNTLMTELWVREIFSADRGVDNAPIEGGLQSAAISF